MSTTIPAPIQPILQSYVAQAQQLLPNRLYTLYVEGSVALGEFNEQFSDIDCLFVLHDPATADELEKWRTIHANIAQAYPRWPLSGWYLPLSELVNRPGHDRLAPVPYYHDGQLDEAGAFELHSVEGWIWRNHGRVFYGPTAAEHHIGFEVDWDIVQAKMHANLNSYWASWVTRPDGWLVMMSDWGIQWVVLGVLRQFYSFREQSITTKSGAGQYGLAHLPSCWHPLIQEALAIRAGQASRTYRWRLARLWDTRRFLRLVIAESNRLLGGKPDI